MKSTLILFSTLLTLVLMFGCGDSSGTGGDADVGTDSTTGTDSATDTGGTDTGGGDTSPPSDAGDAASDAPTDAASDAAGDAAPDAAGCQVVADGTDFGPCDAVLGYAWNGTTCVEFSGCDCAPLCSAFFPGEAECRAACIKD